MIISGLLHWLISQSIFLARIALVDYRGLDKHKNGHPGITTCGYSSIAIIFTIITGAVTLIAVIVAGFRKSAPGIPLLGACSAVISAACHRPADDENAALLPVQWGVVKSKGSTTGHCCITSMEVESPIPGNEYC